MGSVDPVHALHEARRHELSGSCSDLLCLLEEKPDLAGKFVFLCLEDLGRRKQHGGVGVMAAGMAEPFLL